MIRLPIVLVFSMLLCSCGRGDTGYRGEQGTPGLGCSETPINPSNVPGDPLQTGGIMISCPNGYSILSNGINGTNGTNGTNGVNGTAGATGSTGSQGIPGTNATPVTVIQLCKGFTTTYPTSFPEQAVCIDNNLYGVYWTGTEAFLAEIAPGEYSSTSPQTCNFTVSANCEVN